MALRTQIAPNDCIEQYEKAAGEHQNAGFLLLAEGSAQGVALMALSVEMIFKSAVFRLIGYSPRQSIKKLDLRDVEADVRLLAVTLPSEGYHNISFWAASLIALHQQGLPARAHGGSRSYAAVAANPMNSQDEAELRRRTVRLAANWSIGDRYKSLEPYASKQDLEDVFDDTMAITRFYDQGRV